MCNVYYCVREPCNEFYCPDKKSILRLTACNHPPLSDTNTVCVCTKLNSCDHCNLLLYTCLGKYMPWYFPVLIHDITGFVTRLTRWVALVDKELQTLPKHLSSPPVVSGVVFLTLQFYMYVFQIVVCLFVLFLLLIVSSVLLQYTDSDYLFGIFKLFL